MTAITLLVSCLVNGRALRYTVVMTLPDNAGVRRESQQTLDCLSVKILA